MESTGKYWIPVFNILEHHNLWVTLSHPKYTKPMKGNKTDRKDAKWICDLYMCGMVKPSFIPTADIRELRDLVRYRYKLTCMITGEKNRAQNCLRFLYKGIIIKHNKTEPTYTKTSLFLCEKRRFFMARTEKGVVTTI